MLTPVCACAPTEWVPPAPFPTTPTQGRGEVPAAARCRRLRRLRRRHTLVWIPTDLLFGIFEGI
jgi:hypothetical protein